MLRPLRRIVSPDAIGGIDISPILTIVLIQIVKYLLVSLAITEVQPWPRFRLD